MNYQHARTVTRAAQERYNAASQALTNAQMHERLAELENQHEPLETLSGGDPELRWKLYSAAFYVVVGRWPEKPA